MDLETIIGVFASIFTSIAMLPQLIKIIKEKKSEGISYWMLGSLLVGLSLWIWYGCMKSDLIIVVANGLALGINVSVVILSLRYRK